MSRFEDTDCFVRAVESGSITAAAAQLGIAKSAVSRRIRELEARLGAQLLIRSTRKLELTEAGRNYYTRVSDLIRDWHEAEGLVKESTGALSGPLRVAAPLSFSLEHLSDLFLKFSELHPNVELHIDMSDRKVDLISDRIDVAIRVGHLEDSSMIARKIAPIRVNAGASPTYLENHGPIGNIKDLEKMSELQFSHRAQQKWKYKDPAGKAGILEMKSHLSATNGNFLRDAAIAGKGVFIGPSFFFYKAFKNGDLVRLLPDYEFEEFGAYALYPPTRYLSARARALIDFLVKECGNEPYWDQI